MKVLAVVAHPDDEILGPGATLAHHILAGDDVTVAIATVARHGLMTAATAQAAADAIGGAKLRLLGLPYMTLARDQIALNGAVDAIVASIQPATIYTHWSSDLNSDHGAVALAVQVATRPVGGRTRRVLAFETPSSSEWSLTGAFAPNVFVDVAGEALDRKLRAVACYEEEMRPAPHPRGIESLRARAAYWGQVSGCAAAEPFVLVREVVR